MPMKDVADSAFAKARAIYTGKDANKNPIPSMKERYKSSNKLHLAPNSIYINDEIIDYDDGDADDDPAYNGRLAKATQLHGKERIATKVEGNAFDAGMVLRLSNTQALNCMELSLIAAEWAHRELGKPNPPPIALINPAYPADHVFCAIGPRAGLNKSAGKKISDLFNKMSVNDDVWAVDPWLNVCCNIRYYGIRAHGRLMRWQAKNKRVAWNDGPLGAGWYSPLGQYSNGFIDARLEVQLL